MIKLQFIINQPPQNGGPVDSQEAALLTVNDDLSLDITGEKKEVVDLDRAFPKKINGIVQRVTRHDDTILWARGLPGAYRSPFIRVNLLEDTFPKE